MSGSSKRSSERRDGVGDRNAWLERRVHHNRTHSDRRPSVSERRREETLRAWLGEERSTAEFSELRPGPRRLGDVMPEALASLGMRDADVVQRVGEQWDDLVGTDVSRYAKPKVLRRKVLYVEVSNPTWRYILETQHKGSIRQRIVEVFGDEIRDIRFAPPGRVPPSGP